MKSTFPVQHNNALLYTHIFQLPKQLSTRARMFILVKKKKNCLINVILHKAQWQMTWRSGNGVADLLLRVNFIFAFLYFSVSNISCRQWHSYPQKMTIKTEESLGWFDFFFPAETKMLCSPCVPVFCVISELRIASLPLDACQRNYKWDYFVAQSCSCIF